MDVNWPTRGRLSLPWHKEKQIADRGFRKFSPWLLAVSRHHTQFGLQVALTFLSREIVEPMR